MRTKDMQAALAAARAEGRGEALRQRQYNGWTNYETWNVALWIDNDQGSQAYWLDVARTSYRGATDRGIGLTKKEQAAIDLADCLKDWLEENNPLAGQSSLYADILGAAIGDVNFREIAEHFLEDVAND